MLPTLKENILFFGVAEIVGKIKEVVAMEGFMEYFLGMDIICILDIIVQKLTKENWTDDKCPPEFWVSLNNEDMNNQSIMITINHMGYKFTEKLFPRKDTHFGYDSLLNQMRNMYNQTM